MKATIKFYISEAAQRAAIAATQQSVSALQAREIDVTGSDIELFDVSADGTLSLDLTMRESHGEALKAAGVTQSNRRDHFLFAMDADIISIINAGKIKLAEQAVEKKRQQDELRARIEAEMDIAAQSPIPLGGDNHSTWPNPGCTSVTSTGQVMFRGHDADTEPVNVPAHHPLHSAALRWQEEYQQRAREKRAEQDRENEEKEKSESAKEQAKLALITSFIGEHGTDSQKARLAANLLPRKEAIDAICAAAFASLADLVIAEYPEPDCPSDPDEDSNCYDCNVTHRVKLANELCEQQYARFVEISTAARALGNATVEPAELCSGHNCNHDNCRDSSNPAAKVSLAVGPFVFVRYFEI